MIFRIINDGIEFTEKSMFVYFAQTGKEAYLHMIYGKRIAV